MAGQMRAKARLLRVEPGDKTIFTSEVTATLTVTEP